MSLYHHLPRKKQGYNLLFCYSSNGDHIGGINEMITDLAFKSRLPGNAELQLGIVLFPLGEVADVPLAFHVSGNKALHDCLIDNCRDELLSRPIFSFSITNQQLV